MTPRPLILNLAATGMVPTREMSEHVPLQPSEIVADVLRCADAGITVAHLHARDENDEPTHSKDVYARIIAGIREQRPDLVLCVSISGRRAPDFAPRAEVLDLEGDLAPDMASLTLVLAQLPASGECQRPGRRGGSGRADERARHPSRGGDLRPRHGRHPAPPAGARRPRRTGSGQPAVRESRDRPGGPARYRCARRAAAGWNDLEPGRPRRGSATR